MYRYTENRFVRGLNKDLDPRMMTPEFVRQAVNVKLMSEGESYAYRNMKGTLKMMDFKTGNFINLNILATVRCNALYESGVYAGQTKDEYNPSIMVFSYINDVSEISIVDTERIAIHTLYSTTGDDGLDFPVDGTVDARVYREGSIDTVYFTDFKNVPRKIDAVVKPGGLGAYPDYHALTLQRYFPVDTLNYMQILPFGQLTAGVYHFAYRYVSEKDNRYSTWSFITNPVPVSPTSHLTSTTDEIFGGVLGEVCNQSISLHVNVGGSSLSPTKWGIYDSIQLAIIPRVDGSKTPPLVAKKTEPSKEWYNTGDIIYNESIYLEETDIPIEELLRKQSPVETAKTLEIKNNNLFLGNIKYFDRRHPGDMLVDADTIYKQVGGEDIYFPDTSNPNTNNPQFSIDQDCVVSLWVDDSPKGISNGAFGSAKPGYVLHPRALGGVNYADMRMASVTAPVGVSGEGINESYPWTTSNTNTIYSTYVKFNVSDIQPGNKFKITIYYKDKQYLIYNSEYTIFSTSNDPSCGGTLNYNCVTYEYEYTAKTTNINEVLDALENFLLGVNAITTTNAYDALRVIRLTDGIRIEHGGNNIFFNCGGEDNNFFADYRIAFEVDLGFDTSKNKNTIGVNADDSLSFNAGYANPNNCVRSKGYFRDELYRFGSIFVDQYGNESNVGPYDFTAIGGTSDWLFPNRQTAPILDAQDSIVALGLGIDNDITKVPDWAVAMAVVRMDRIPRILDQSIHVPVMSIFPAINVANIDTNKPQCVPVSTDSILGTFVPKKHMMSCTYNIIREDPTGRAGVYHYPEYVYQDNINIPNRIIRLSCLFPTTYIFNFQGTPFRDYNYIPGSNLEIVDAVMFYSTDIFAVDGGTIPIGTSYKDQLACAFRADNHILYYYKYTVVPDLDSNDGYGQFFEKNKYEIRDTVSMPLGAEPYVFPTTPMPNNFQFNNVPDYWNINGAIGQNGDRRDVDAQRSAVALIDGFAGDLTFLSSDLFIQDSNPFVRNSVKFNGTGFGVPTGFYSATDIFGNEIADPGSDAPKCSTVIFNITTDKSNDRYGNQNSSQSYISTGTSHPIDEYIALNGSVEVFGGDCFITKAYFKQHENHVMIFDNTGDTAGCGDGVMLHSYQDFIEIMGYYVESEINCKFRADRFTYPVIDDKSLNEFKAFYEYYYLFNYSANNDIVTYFSLFGEGLDLRNKNTFPSRILYSEKKVYQSDIEGFDTFLPASYYDLDETLGAITKLIKIRDNEIFCFQEHAICQVPVGRNTIESGIGQELIINSTDIITTPRYYTTEYGCQHMRTVVANGSEIFFVDVSKKIAFSVGNGLEAISAFGMFTYFSNLLDVGQNNIPETKLFGFYDFEHDEYTIVQNIATFIHPNHYWAAVWSNKNKAWVNTMSLDHDTGFMSGCFQNQEMNVFGYDINQNITWEQLYNGSCGEMFSAKVNSSLELIVNPEGTVGKVFDVVMVDSSNPVEGVMFTVDHNAQDQLMSVAVGPPRRHDSEWVSIPKKGNRRLRGKYLRVLLNMGTINSPDIVVKGVITKYRLEHRTQNPE